jgi:hypothetical protein
VTDQTQKPAEQGGKTQVGEALAPSARRRAFVRAASAVPVILTLHSGAALAVSSNLISTVDNYADGSANCLDTSGLDEVADNVYDLGPTPSATVYKLSDDNKYYLYIDGQKKGRVRDLKAMCKDGGTFITEGGDVFTIPKPLAGGGGGGGLVSATALGSFAGRINTRVL